MKRWWLSYVAPSTNTFLGVCLVDAEGFVEACATAKAKGCSPGGEVAGVDLPDPPEAGAEWALPTNKLLSQQELEAALAKDNVKSLREWEAS